MARNAAVWFAAAVAVLVATEQEGQTSTFTSWNKALPGMCVTVEIAIPNHGDRGETEARILRETTQQLDAVAARLAPPLQARLAHYLKSGGPLVGLLAPTELATCPDVANADNPKHPAFVEAQRWSEPIALDQLTTLLHATAPPPSNRPGVDAPDRLQGTSSWRGVGVRLRLAKPTDAALRAKVATDLVIAQFHGGPPASADRSITLDLVAGRTFDDPGAELFAALVAVARDRRAAAALHNPILDALGAALDGQPLPANAVDAPEALIIALWSARETPRLAAWAAALAEHGYFLDARTGDALLRYLAAAGTPLPALPAAKWQARLAAAAAEPRQYDDILHDLMKLRTAVAGEDAIIHRIWDLHRARPTYNEWQSVIRVLEQLGFAQRPLAIVDRLFVETAQLASAGMVPAGYKPGELVHDVADQMWRMQRPLAPATVAAVVDEAMKFPDDAAPAAITALLNIRWSLPDRVALVAKLAACPSCRATAKQSIGDAVKAEQAARASR